MNISAYIDRIGFQEPLSPTLPCLIALQRCHVMAVPFENLDIYYGTEIILDRKRIYDKVVGKRRGGFCYELNSLFCELLQQVGFEVKMVAAGVYSSTKGVFSNGFDHLALIVSLAGMDYLVDVGFGRFSLHPLALVLGLEQEDGFGAYKIERLNNEYLQVVRKPEEEWVVEYKFSLDARELQEFAPRCHFQQTSPDSIFTQGALCTKATEQGRITLTDKMLKILTGEAVQESPIATQAEFEDLLWKYFQINP